MKTYLCVRTELGEATMIFAALDCWHRPLEGRSDARPPTGIDSTRPVDRRQRADRREAQDAADRDRQPEAAQLVQELVRDGRLELEPRGPTGQARVDQRDRRAPPLFSRARVVAGAVQVFFVLLESLQHAPPELGDFIGLGAVVDAPHGAALRGARFLREGRVRVSYDAVQGALPVVGGLLVRQRDDRREPPALRGAQRQRRRGRGRVFRRGPAVPASDVTSAAAGL